MSEIVSYFDSPEDHARMQAMAAMLGQDYIKLRSEYLAATRGKTPVSVQPTPESSLHADCGGYNLEWRLGQRMVTGYVGTAFPDILPHLSDGSQFAHAATSVPDFGTGRIGQMRARYHERRLSMRLGDSTVKDTLLETQARSVRGFITCVTVETPELPGHPKALHSVNCESVNSQFMLSAFQGEPEALAEMHEQLTKTDPDAFHYDALRDLYLPPAIPVPLDPAESFGKDR